MYPNSPIQTPSPPGEGWGEGVPGFNRDPQAGKTPIDETEYMHNERWLSFLNHLRVSLRGLPTWARKLVLGVLGLYVLPWAITESVGVRSVSRACWEPLSSRSDPLRDLARPPYGPRPGIRLLQAKRVSTSSASES